MIFSRIIFVNFIGESTVVFLTKHCQLLLCFSLWFFFLLKLSLSIFFFNIKLVENLALYFFLFINRKAKSSGKTQYLSSQNTVDCYKSFCSVSKFFITNTTFFSIMKYCSIIHLVSITYLALVHNYNTIKYICFINSQQHVNIPSENS
jgi:hypothetical protein